MHKVQQRQQGIPDFSYSHPFIIEKHFFKNEQNESFKSSYFRFSQLVSSPETVSLGPNSYGCVKVSGEDLELNSPSSVKSSLFQEQAKVGKTRDKFLQEAEEEEEEGTVEAQGLDEAIAWAAKEKFQSYSSLEDWSMKQHEKEVSAEVAERPVVFHIPDGQTDGCGLLHLQADETPNNWKTEEERKTDEYVKFLTFN